MPCLGHGDSQNAALPPLFTATRGSLAVWRGSLACTGARLSALESSQRVNEYLHSVPSLLCALCVTRTFLTLSHVRVRPAEGGCTVLPVRSGLWVGEE